MLRRPAEPRPYLRASDRRTQLLAAAAAVIGRDGLGSLTMAAVAAESGVSRQWVYEHFSGLDDLYRALILDRFAALDADLDVAKVTLTGAQLAIFAARRLFALLPADRRILRALVDGTGWNRPELAGIESDLRELILGRWTGFVRGAGHGELEARAIVWATVNAVFGLADQIERESLEVDRAVAVLELLLTAINVRPAPRHRVRRRPARADAAHQPATGGSHAH
jgi:AcrR family transcriptional regulator